MVSLKNLQLAVDQLRIDLVAISIASTQELRPRDDFNLKRLIVSSLLCNELLSNTMGFDMVKLYSSPDILIRLSHFKLVAKTDISTGEQEGLARHELLSELVCCLLNGRFHIVKLFDEQELLVVDEILSRPRKIFSK